MSITVAPPPIEAPPPPSRPSQPSAAQIALSTPELLLIILRTLDQQTQSTVSLVSKLWLDLSTVARMSTVTLVEGGISPRRLDWLVSRLLERPELGHYVKQLSLDHFAYRNQYHALLANTVIRCLVNFCPNLEAVTLRNVESASDLVSLLAITAAHCRNLVSLTITGGVSPSSTTAAGEAEHAHADASALSAHLRHLPKLRHLTLPIDCLSHCTASRMGSPPQFEMESFAFAERAMGPSELAALEWFLSSSRSTLRRMSNTAGCASPAVGAWLATQCPALEEVKLRVGGTNRALDENTILGLVRLPRLRTLSLSYMHSNWRSSWSLDVVYPKGREEKKKGMEEVMVEVKETSVVVREKVYALLGIVCEK